MSSLTHNPDIPKQTTPVNLWHLLRVWLALGFQSFGGGSATLFMIRRASVEQEKWVTEEEFTRYWGISQVTPGINLLCMTILIGWRVAGTVGVVITLFGLLFPSVSITILLTMLYAQVQQITLVQAALSGIIPATVGIGLLLIWQTGRPLVREAIDNGHAPLAISLLVLLASVLVSLYTTIPVIVILCGGGLINGLFLWWYRSTQSQGGQA